VRSVVYAIGTPFACGRGESSPQAPPARYARPRRGGARKSGEGVSGAMERMRATYGPWAVVAGASEGLGAEFARQLAAAGLNVVAVARRQELLDALAAELAAAHAVEVRTLALDLADREAPSRVRAATRDLEVGLLVYNAALSLIGPFLERDAADAERMLDVNARTPLLLVHAFGRDMSARGRGGVLLVSSLSALQGSPRIAVYAATKAFGLILGESLWAELRGRGVDVLAFCAGATRTPNYEASRPRRLSRLAPAVMEPAAVVAEALAALGRGPSGVAGRGNRLGSLLLQRLLPRRWAVGIMDRTTRALYEPET